MKVTQSVSALALVSYTLASGPLPVGKTAALSLASAFLTQASVAHGLPSQRRSEEAGNGGLLGGLLGGGQEKEVAEAELEAGKGPGADKGLAEAELEAGKEVADVEAAAPPPPPPAGKGPKGAKGPKGVDENVAAEECDIQALHPDIDLAAIDQATLNAVVQMIAKLGPIDPAVCEAAVVDNEIPPPPPNVVEEEDLLATETPTDVLETETAAVVDELETATEELAAEITATEEAEANITGEVDATATEEIDTAIETNLAVTEPGKVDLAVETDVLATETALEDIPVETAVAEEIAMPEEAAMGEAAVVEPEAIQAVHHKRQPIKRGLAENARRWAFSA